MLEYPEMPISVISTSKYKQKMLNILKNKYQLLLKNKKFITNQGLNQLYVLISNCINDFIQRIVSAEPALKYVLDTNVAIPQYSQNLMTGMDIKEYYVPNVRRSGMFTGELGTTNPKNVKVANHFEAMANHANVEKLYVWSQDLDSYRLATVQDVLSYLKICITNLKNN